MYRLEQSNPIALKADDEARFSVTEPVDIQRILRGLMQRRELVTLYCNGGEDFFVSALLDVDGVAGTLVVDSSNDAGMNQRMTEAERVVFVSTLDKVGVRFASTEMQLEDYLGQPAFLLPLPRQIRYLQRREYYRLPMPLANPVKCRVPLAQDAHEEMIVVDISAGGIGILADTSREIPLEIGAIHFGCAVALPGIGTLEVGLQARNHQEVLLKNGHAAHRWGCQFVALQPALQSQLQRYIVKLERARIASTPGR